MSVSREGAVPADPSQVTLRVEAVSPGNLSTKLVSLASISSTFHKEVQTKGTHAVNPRTDSNAGSGRGGMPGRKADSSLAVHPYFPSTFQGVFWSWCWVNDYASLIDTGARLGSGGNSLVSLADSDSDIRRGRTYCSERYRDFPGR